MRQRGHILAQVRSRRRIWKC